MKAGITQCYVEVGVKYLFSYVFQKYISEKLRNLVVENEVGGAKYPDFSFVFYLSAKKSLSIPEVKGPSILKRSKSIEYSVFLPGPSENLTFEINHQEAIFLLIDCISNVLEKYGYNTDKLREAIPSIVEVVFSDPSMFDRT